MENNYYRYVLVNLQETCYCQVDQLIPGWFTSSEDALASIGYTKECFAAFRLEFTETPERLIKKMK